MHPVTIRTVQPEDLECLIALYIACFREPPWYEVFTPEEVGADFATILSYPETVFLVAVDGDGRVLGAAIGFDVRHKSDVWERLPYTTASTFYLAEVFVDLEARGHGTCQWLLRAASDAAAKKGFEKISARTSVNQPIIRHVLVEKMGCAVVGTEEVVSRKVVGVQVVDAPDTRVLMVGPTRVFDTSSYRGCGY